MSCSASAVARRGRLVRRVRRRVAATTDSALRVERRAVAKPQLITKINQPEVGLRTSEERIISSNAGKRRTYAPGKSKFHQIVNTYQNALRMLLANCYLADANISYLAHTDRLGIADCGVGL